jgi:hypothetical protein
VKTPFLTGFFVLSFPPNGYFCNPMSSFVRRLKYYGIGFGIGLLFVVFFFKNRGCSWLPGNRVKNAITERVVFVHESDLARFNKEFSKEYLNLLLLEGEIDFSNSDKKGPNKCYKMTWNDQTLYFSLQEESFVSLLSFDKKKEDLQNKGKAQVILFPKNKSLLFVDSSNNNLCVLDEYKWNDWKKLQREMEKTTFVDLSQTQLEQGEKPIHRLMFLNKKRDTIQLDAFWYKDKINVVRFIGMDSVKCN